ncbi:MAG: isoprenyl transferase [Chloroflexi bacterium]|nr:isoprenyl transferase [Chloroflexota bacterium]
MPPRQSFAQERAEEQSARSSAVPRHVAIIMDGNGRWAQERGLPRLAGHRAGTKNIRRVLKAFDGLGVRYVTIYAFSTENWTRPPEEVKGLWRLLGQVIGRESRALHKNNVRIRHIGRMDRLPPSLQKAIDQALELTKENTGITLTVALDYGGRAELVEAVRRLLQEGLRPGEVTEEAIAVRLHTGGLPDPDLIIRTGGEMRLSNFLIWQSAYAEYYASPVCWPDFDEAETAKAVEAYGRRQRKFGGLLHANGASAPESGGR